MKQFQIKFWVNSAQKKLLDDEITKSQWNQGEYIKNKLFGRDIFSGKPQLNKTEKEDYESRIRTLELEKISLNTELESEKLKVLSTKTKLDRKTILYSTKFQDIFYKLAKGYIELGDTTPKSEMFNPQLFIQRNFSEWELNIIQNIAKTKDYLMRELP